MWITTPTPSSTAAPLATGKNTLVTHGDLLKPQEILDDPKVRALIDFDQPVAILIVAILHFVSGENDHHQQVSDPARARPWRRAATWSSPSSPWTMHVTHAMRRGSLTASETPPSVYPRSRFRRSPLLGRGPSWYDLVRHRPSAVAALPLRHPLPLHHTPDPAPGAALAGRAHRPPRLRPG